MRIETKKKLDHLKETKSLIRGALIEKGIEIGEDDTFRSYAETIRNTSIQSSDVRYVTFMNGVKIEYVKPVATGDDCVDVLTKGLISTPTKASTDAEVFTYSGWARTDGGDVDASALTAVTENRTVYAAYTSEVRYYTITYYDSDGVTVMNTESFAYGATPSYTPNKDGFNFDGWVPALATVTGDASYVAVWSEKITFAGGAWADIARISESGEAPDYFKVGDTKTITVGDSALELILIGFDHDDLADGSGKAGMTIVATTALADTMPVSNWSTLARTMQTKLKPQLPSELQDVIKTVNKPCDVSAMAQVVTPVNVAFDLFPLSFNECKVQAYGARKNTDSDWENYFTTLGTTYQYFIDKYNSTWLGPYNSFLGTTKGFWFRQWGRFGSTPEGLVHNVVVSTASKKYAKNVSYTSNYPVMIAFCI